MPRIIVREDMSMEITDEKFSQISRELHNEQSNTETKKKNELGPDGTYEKKPLNENY